jgi:predicted nucleic acid-binding protein
LHFIETNGISISNTEKSVEFMIDESDRKFYDVAKKSKAFLITGNQKHFPNESFILSPTIFLNLYLKRVTLLQKFKRFIKTIFRRLF